ncbi:MAG: SGNH/GDSL hydrolase family protein, partial [Candidatus Aenigmatarchaeota archaeon]
PTNNTDFRYKFQPNYTQLADGEGVCIPPYKVHINSHGFRDHEYNKEKPENVFRIVTLGDSITMGHGVELNETYSKVLQRLLNNRSENVTYQVLNFGFPGYNLQEKEEVFHSKVVEFNPDVIVLQYLPDDLYNWTRFEMFERKALREYKRAHNLERVSDMGLRIAHLNANKMYMRYLERMHRKKPEKVEDRLRRYLRKMDRIYPQRPFLILAPRSFEFSTLEKIADDYGWHVLEMDSAYEGYSEEEVKIHEKDEHPNALGHRLLALHLHRKLKDMGVLD